MDISEIPHGLVLALRYDLGLIVLIKAKEEKKRGIRTEIISQIKTILSSALFQCSV